MANTPIPTPIHAVAAESAGAASVGGFWRAVAETTKPGITRMVTITSGVGFAVAASSRPWTLNALATAAIGALIGTALSASGANALNQWAEWRRDALMPRTCARPLPQGRITPAAAFLAGVVMSLAGLLVLLALTSATAALVSLTCIVTYVLAYTPLKPVSPLATFVGAIPGALPPLIGWAAASRSVGPIALLEPGALCLFAIMFAWQIPHFLAIAWLYRDDYKAGGFKVLPVLDESGVRTARTIAVWAVLLLLATLAPIAWVPQLGPIYAAVAIVTGGAFGVLIVRLVRRRSREAARRVFIASVIHLPILLLAMVGDALLGLVV